MKKWKIGLSVALVVLFAAVYLDATGTYHRPMPRGAGIAVGDILYFERNDSMTNLSAGLNGKVLQAAGASTAPAYIAKNIHRVATLNFNATTTGLTPSADNLLCKLLIASNGGSAATLVLPDTTGLELIIRNMMTTALTVTSPAGGSTKTVEATVTKRFIHNGTLYVTVGSIAN